MNLSKNRYVIIPAGILSILSAGDAQACGGCLIAVLEISLPFVMGWFFFAALWFLAISIAASFIGKPIGWVPTLAPAVLVVIVVYFLSALSAGPILMFILLVVSFVSVLAETFGNKTLKRKEALALKTVLVIGFAGFIGLSITSSYISATRSPSDFILSRQDGLGAKKMLEYIISNGDENLPELRTVVEKGNPLSASTAVKGVAKFGHPDIDIPFLARQIEKCRQGVRRNCDEYVLNAFENALKILQSKNQGEVAAQNGNSEI